MSIKFLSRHVAKPGDTLESLVSEYRLSSWRAIADIEANLPVRGQLVIRGTLPLGLMVSIPPNASELLKERLYLLHRVRPAFLAHFDGQALQVEQDLVKSLLKAGAPEEAEGMAELLAALQKEVDLTIEDLAHQTWPLVSICVGMTHTHVAERIDILAAGTLSDSLCGLYWAISPPILGLWQQLWDMDTWLGKWRGRDPAAASQLVQQFQNTVRSLVVQQIDQRIREAQKLERDLHQEGYQ
jgi:hypothetical protein